MGYIYKITNIKNNKCYIGVTTISNPESRWKGHKSSIKAGKGCPLLRAAFNKHGEESFKFEVLIICFDEDLYIYEKKYIVKYNSLAPNGYNAHEGGEFGGNFIGKKHSDETKKIMSIKSHNYNSRQDVRERARRVVTEFNKNNNIGELMRNSTKWQKAKEEGRIGCSGHNKERNDEIKKKISKGLKKYFENNKEHHSEIMTKINGKKINQYSLDNILLASFDSIILASKGSGIGRCSIQANASGRTKSAGGFIWKYSEKEPKEIIQQ
jgi:group I intron endonuclease